MTLTLTKGPEQLLKVYCQICGISFNIGRIRTHDEPRGAGWSCGGDDIQYGEPECMPDTGCSVVVRNKAQYADTQWGVRGEMATFGDQLLEASIEGDEDYEDRASESDEPLEWDSEAGELDEEDDDGDGTAKSSEDTDEDYREFWKRGLATLKTARKDFLTHEEMIPRWRKVDRVITRAKSKQQQQQQEHEADPADGFRHYMDEPSWKYQRSKILLEHIAGPGCDHDGGYNGHRIGASEMKFCQTVQCLLRKDSSWRPEADDEAFERTSGIFLSGLSDYMPSRDSGSPRVFPERHGVSSPYTDNVWYVDDDDVHYAMPFHPYCLEVFKSASRLRQHGEDLEGLVGWWIKESDHKTFTNGFPRHPAVRRGEDQWWSHHVGDEFLAANPLFVPGLDEILTSAVRTDTDFDVRASPFSTARAPANNDFFAVLPEELRSMLLAQLSSKDIANLRLGSRTFTHLPYTLFHDLLKREMPFLWEAWSATPYSFWATTTAQELKAQDELQREERQELDAYLEVLYQEMPEMTEQHAEVKARVLADWKASGRGKREPRPHLVLQWDKTDWYQVYLQITKGWGKMKGLQNRERIWTDCQEIMRRVEGYRELGQLPDLRR